ncbi:hypothetical protein PRIC2_011989 [Phytophthora ramorum]
MTKLVTEEKASMLHVEGADDGLPSSPNLSRAAAPRTKRSLFVEADGHDVTATNQPPYRRRKTSLISRDSVSPLP